MKTIIIIPTYNEIDNVRPLLQEIFLYAPDTDVLIVDDNSPDGTGKLADEIHDEDPRVHVMHRTEKAGLGKAYIAGFKYAIEHGYDAAFEMDYRARILGFTIVETPIVFMDRRVGKSKMSRQIVIEGITYVLHARFSKKPVVRTAIEEQDSVYNEVDEEASVVGSPPVVQK